MMRAIVLTVLLAAALACGPRATHAPGGDQGATPLAVPLEAKSDAPAGPVRVLHYGPSGEVESNAEISIVFDRPMRALGTDTSATDLLRIEPAVDGEGQWVGSQAIVFRPRQGFAMATSYHVALSSDLRAIDGQKLEAPCEFSFVTPAPALESASPYDGERGVETTRRLEMRWNQAVSIDELARSLHVEVQHRGARKAWAVRVEQPAADDPRLLRVVPVSPWPRAAKVVFRIAGSLVGASGPRPLGGDVQTAFHTFEPLMFGTDAPCGQAETARCDPRGGVAIPFSNPVKLRAAAAALVFDPPLRTPLRREDFGDVESSYLFLYKGLVPLTRYSVSVKGSLRDVFGQTWKAPRKLTFETGPFERMAELPSSGGLAEAGSHAALPLLVRNLPRGEVRMRRLSVDGLVQRLSRPDTQDAPPTLPPLRALRVALPKVGPAEERTLSIDVTPVLDGGKGAVEVEVAADGEESLAGRLLTYTDLAPTLKVSSRGGVVWVTRMGSAEPVRNADVRVFACGVELASAKSDAAGVARFALSHEPQCGVVAVVTKDGDLSHVEQYAGLGPYALVSSSADTDQSELDGFLFTDRSVVRPSESLTVKGIVRRHSPAGLVLPKGSVTLEVLDAGERSLLGKLALPLSAQGAFDTAFSIPADVKLGRLQLRASIDDTTFGTDVEVAEFRRAELSADLSAARGEIVTGESARLHLTAEYLFGAKVTDQPFTWAARRLDGEVRPTGEVYEGFSFEDVRRHFDLIQPPDATETQGGEGRLDAAGEGNFEARLATDGPGGAVRYEIEAVVDGLGGASVATQTLLEVTPAAFLVGVRAASSIAEQGQPVHAQAVAARLDGARDNARAIALTLERHVVEDVPETDGRGARVLVPKARTEIVARCNIVGKAQGCDVVPTRAGLHFLRAEAKDARGRLTTASTTVYVYGGDVALASTSDGPVLEIRADKRSYQPGERARIVVPSPFVRAEALITVEREGVLSVERRSVGAGEVIIDMPMDARFEPNGFVSVLLVRPRSAPTEADQGRPDYRIGVVELGTDTSAQKLAVEVVPAQTTLAPGAELSVDLRVQDARGQGLAAELTVFAVDEGVLALSGYRTPDPYAHFYRSRGLSVWTSDARSELVVDDESGLVGEKGGGEGGGGGVGMRRDFRPLAYFNPRVATDAAGKAQVRFKLPDSITKYRVMAVAAAGARAFGSGASAVRTKKRLSLRPALPRVLRAGDHAQVGVAVHNETDAAMDVGVRIKTEGVTLQGPAEQRVLLAPRTAREVRFALSAERVGEARLAFSASSGADADALLITRNVLPPSVLETVTTVGQTHSSHTESLGALPALRDDVGGLRIRLATSAITELAEVSEALMNYPYACTEQVASRLLGMSSLLALGARGYAAEGVSEDGVAHSLAELLRRQRPDGGFVLWPAQRFEDDPHFSAFLSAHAARALSAAAAAGLPGATQGLASVGEYLTAYLRSEGGRDAPERFDATRSFVVAALASAGRVDASLLATLFERRKGLALSAQADLFAAATEARIQAVPGAERWVSTLLQELAAQIHMTVQEAHLEVGSAAGRDTYLASDLRTTALFLMGLLRHDSQHVLVAPLARYLGTEKGRDGTWGNTHDNAWGLHALARYADVVEHATPELSAVVRLGGRVLLRSELKGRAAEQTTNVPMHELTRDGASVSIEKRGEGLLHHAVSLSFARKELPTSGLARGFFITRRYERIKPADLLRASAAFSATDAVSLGDYVRVVLQVVVPAARDFVLIEDPLPAGLEPVNTLFSTASGAAERALGLATGPFEHRELFDDRVAFAARALSAGVYTYSYLARAVTPGVFVVPAAKVEAMYHPETMARTAAGELRVGGP
jgi:uncharacterized protein YfaS (alpha-2-macroglobulin family)